MPVSNNWHSALRAVTKPHPHPTLYPTWPIFHHEKCKHQIRIARYDDLVWGNLYGNDFAPLSPLRSIVLPAEVKSHWVYFMFSRLTSTTIECTCTCLFLFCNALIEVGDHIHFLLNFRQNFHQFLRKFWWFEFSIEFSPNFSPILVTFLVNWRNWWVFEWRKCHQFWWQ